MWVHTRIYARAYVHIADISVISSVIFADLASKEKYCSMVRSHASGVVSPSLDVIKPLSEIHSIFQSISQFFTTLKNVEDELVCPEDDG